MMRRIVSAGVIGFALLTAATFTRPPQAAVGITPDIADACRYWETRARPARATAPGEFVVFLAHACAAAKVSLDTGRAEQRRRAVRLLEHIAGLRKTVAAINADRLRRAAANPLSGPPVPVSPAGEFLIAHRMGLLDAFEAWLDSGADFSLASYP